MLNLPFKALLKLTCAGPALKATGALEIPKDRADAMRLWCQVMGGRFFGLQTRH